MIDRTGQDKCRTSVGARERGEAIPASGLARALRWSAAGRYPARGVLFERPFLLTSAASLNAFNPVFPWKTGLSGGADGT